MLAVVLAAGGVSAQEVATSPGWKASVASKCRNVRHVPRDDVAYQPGVTREGWAVAKADLNEPLRIDPDTVTSSLDLPITSYIGNPGAYNAPLQEMRLHVGKVTMQQGDLFLDGKPLQQNSEEWNAMCKELNAPR